MKIIVADAAEPMRRLVVSYLEDRQFFVAHVDSLENLKPLLKNKVELLILDVALLDRPLEDFLETHREEYPDLPVILLSDLPLPDEERVLEAGAFDSLF